MLQLCGNIFYFDFSPVGMNPYQTDVVTHRNSGLPVNFYFRHIQWYLLRTNGCSAGICWLKLGVMPSNSWQAPGYQFITSSCSGDCSRIGKDKTIHGGSVHAGSSIDDQLRIEHAMDLS